MLKLLLIPILLANGNLQKNEISNQPNYNIELNPLYDSTHLPCDCEVANRGFIVHDINIDEYNVSSCGEITDSMCLKELSKREKELENYCLADNESSCSYSMGARILGSFLGNIICTICGFFCGKEFAKREFHTKMIDTLERTLGAEIEKRQKRNSFNRDNALGNGQINMSCGSVNEEISQPRT